MGGEDAGEGAVGGNQLDAVPGKTVVIGVLDGAVSAAVLEDLGTDRARHSRSQTVRADHEPGVDLNRGAAAVVAVHTDGPTGIVEPDPGDRYAKSQVGARLGGGLGHDGVQNVAAGRDQQVYPALSLTARVTVSPPAVKET